MTEQNGAIDLDEPTPLLNMTKNREEEEWNDQNQNQHRNVQTISNYHYNGTIKEIFF